MRALLSTYDKTGVVPLARGLADAGWELTSSGGTARAIAEAGIPVTDVADLTGAPAILGHRVMTLHPKVHGGLLADRDDASHRADMEAHDIEGIDLLVSNLYPFGSDPADFTHGGSSGAIDLIDIGGPAMIRAGAKNHAHVAVVVDPADYDEVLAEVQADGAVSAATRRRLAAKAFATTAAYDTAIAAWFRAEVADDDGTAAEDPLPEVFEVRAEREPVALRYGENPHQQAALYRTDGADPWWGHITQHSGLALSYLNLYDADAAWLLAHDLAQATGQVACAIIKHANPCGAAVAATPAEAYASAFACDPRSAFGGIVALSVPIDADTVEHMVGAAQADVVIAPGYADGVVDALRAKRKNTRLLEAPAPTPDPLHVRPVSGGYLVQEPHRFVAPASSWRVVTERIPTEAELADAALAFRLCGWVTSNSIVLVKDGVAWGIGAGQQNRVEAGQIATAKADRRAAGGACASDAFYPFPDGVEAAAEAGVAVVVQPGGSVRDDEVTAKADELGLSMLFTGERHFLH
ncbi:bifunctional phosphoribosylaminoimidazolecarboxamide formyltransferase/IMP cyclohydrolase [Iamia majanohamensis]|uniref:Bifunctional purine biosynthesis protein PurH n=1 Tax=Iamia majanohamensis TaxID=467976 RepID=A0AAE9Y6H4_9ACTN|nr:bifunctional phosphoribosylaminoimidazolecarboxamide formyltransferase/IMP cyclohydrolase [Iamia majanohamensis]WCO67452.1 bifunctional phosphoribosylaminoimidazolecarboxamide formyltransferase/IMP cyclohydrolase [Iamia majanohamensis]